MTKGRAETSQHASLLGTYFSSSPWLQQSYSKRCGTTSRPWLGELPGIFPADLVWEELRILRKTMAVPLAGTQPSSPVPAARDARRKTSRARERLPKEFWGALLMGRVKPFTLTHPGRPSGSGLGIQNETTVFSHSPQPREKWGEQREKGKHKRQDSNDPNNHHQLLFCGVSCF